ncbi:TetR/AcrR family transcriptional regulator [Clostridium sp. A1-XYC3]|uniref:TetR/AcrR family transcriptional regulator n=1 Tax=Clostridium tanneri TaxID=3037988 RepID=A0ABU4JVW2_9CLOT|nr:TetR/AcrR family transcriptional regulator [Clostridium sp. A1-XYC3]MDW8802263.1 TetR/AcrR family transcriptional regulator [Clostridium sp. A1-XYC3]
MEMDKKAIQRKRMMKYFIDAVEKIIQEEGIEFVTIRKVSDIAGFNSATIYNYFGNLNELLFFSSIKYLEDYAHDLPNYTNSCSNSLDTFMGIWRCFCLHSYKNPRAYYNLFFEEGVNPSNSSIRNYFHIFSDELSNQSEELLPMLLGERIYDRNLTILKKCAKDGFIKEEDLEEINEMILLIYHSMLYRVLKHQCSYTAEEATEKTLSYIGHTINSFRNTNSKA